MLLNANHKKKEFMFNNNIVVIKEGQILTGREQLSADTGISESTIERILKMLENEHQIEQQKTTKYRIITILNWREYQSGGHQNGQPLDNKRTTSGQQADTNKNDKNGKNVNNDNNVIPPEPSQSEVESFTDLEHHLAACWGRNGQFGHIIIRELLDLGNLYGKQRLYDAIKTAGMSGKEKSNPRYVKGILEKQDLKKKEIDATRRPRGENPFILMRCRCNYEFNIGKFTLQKYPNGNVKCAQCETNYIASDILGREQNGKADFSEKEEEVKQ